MPEPDEIQGLAVHKQNRASPRQHNIYCRRLARSVITCDKVCFWMRLTELRSSPMGKILWPNARTTDATDGIRLPVSPVPNPAIRETHRGGELGDAGEGGV